MLELQHILPPGCKPVVPGLSATVKEMMPTLIETVAKCWTQIPDSDLELLLKFKENTPILAFRKYKTEVYLNIFGFNLHNRFRPLALVSDIYLKFKMGIPESPKAPNWIHAIPLTPQTLSPAETLLMHRITHSLFWTVYMDCKKRLENINK
ncbi:MAG TPA: hypothetical protein VGM41_20890 [Chitinophagaceae bacterium]|jgi:hypothetical protein